VVIFYPIFASDRGHVRDGGAHGCVHDDVHDGRDVRGDDDVRHACDRISFMSFLQQVLFTKI